MFDISADSANFWFDISNVILFVGAILVAAGTYGVYKIGAIKEHFADLRISANEAETARAKADIAGAEARAAEANARALEAQTQLAGFKAPRAMTSVGRAKLILSLTKYAGEEAAIYILGDGPEPYGLASSIQDALIKAQWKPLTWNWSGAGATVGVVVTYKAAEEIDIRLTCEALADALNGAGIVTVVEAWPGDWNHFGGLLNGPSSPSPTEAPIRIIIGTKPQ